MTPQVVRLSRASNLCHLVFIRQNEAGKIRWLCPRWVPMMTVLFSLVPSHCASQTYATRSKCLGAFQLRARRYLTICMGNTVERVSVGRVLLAKVISASQALSRSNGADKGYLLAAGPLISSKRAEHRR